MPDRLARSVAGLLSIIGRLEARKVRLRVLSMGGSEVHTAAPTGRLMLTVLGAVAVFERDLMLERQREGIAKAKEAGRYKGRKPTGGTVGDSSPSRGGAGHCPRLRNAFTTRRSPFWRAPSASSWPASWPLPR